MRRRAFTFFALLAAACSLSSVGSGPEGSDAGASIERDSGASLDGAPTTGDASPSNTEAGGGADASDASAPDAPDAPVDPTVSYDCPGGAVSSCAQCPARPTGCVYCADIGSSLKGLCIATNTLCFNVPPVGYHVCPCTYPNASSCPMSNQACRDYTPNYCTTCGDPNSDGSPCKRGGTCDRATATCR